MTSTGTLETPVRTSSAFRFALAAVVLLSAAAAGAPPTPPAGPVAAHHQHLLSPAVAQRISLPVLPTVEVPEDVARLLRARAAAESDTVALAALYTEQALVFEREEGTWIRGRAAAARFMGGLFAQPYTVTPIAYGPGHLEGYLTRTVDGQPRHFGNVLLSLERGDDGEWRIASETESFPGPIPEPVYGADRLIAMMDSAGTRQAVLLSLGYGWASVHRPPVQDELGKVRTENDWTAAEAARYPDRLVAFCGVSPMRDYAVTEIDRCARELGMKGLKLHFANSGVNVLNPAHVERARAVFRAANRNRMPIVVHLWTNDPSYGAEHSRVFLEQILPEAPDVVVQVAHLAGAGPGYGPDAALAPLAEAVAAGDPRTRNLYFDVTTSVTFASPASETEMVARRIRQIGPERILFGSDGAWGGNPTIRQAWGAFRGMVPLTDEEFRVIANNVAPYLR